MKIQLTPHSSKLAAKDTTLDLLATIAFPEKPQDNAKRPSLNLALVLDQSGSMASNDAFGQAKRATLSLVSKLHDDDRVAVILYNGYARTILPSCPASQAKQALAGLLLNERAGGSTALHAGWLAGAAAVAPHVNEYDVSRVLLLSDGQATDGKSDPSSLREEAYQLLAAGVSTSTYGLGLHFNEDLMTGMAAGGSARYAADAEQLDPYFDADLQMLAQTAANGIKLSVHASVNGDPVQVNQLNDYPSDAQGRWQLPPGISGSECWAALNLEGLPSTGAIKINAQWTWKDMEGKEHVHDTNLVVERGRGKKNIHVVERVAEAKAAHIAKQAALAARRGNLQEANAAITRMRTLSASNAYINSVSDNLERLALAGNASEMAKEALYCSTTMSARVADVNEDHRVMAKDRFGLRKVSQGRHEQDKEA